MKIAFFHELDTGGARRGANEFAGVLKKQGHLVDLFIIDNKHDSSEKKYYSDIYYFLFCQKQWSGNDWKLKLYKDSIEIYKLYHLHRKIAREINSNKYDFLFVHGSKYTQAPFLMQFVKCRKIYYCQEPLRMIYDPLFSIPKNLSLLKKYYEKVTRSLKKQIDVTNIRKADIILANSNYTRDNIQKAYGLSSTVCHMGVDKDIFYPEGIKEYDILFIGARDIFDGYPLFKNCIKYLKVRPRIKYLIRGENWVTSDGELRKLYSKARIVICFGYHEPFGLIPLEAMACGAVPVALNEGGYKDSVQHGKTGMLVGKNPAAIAEVIDHLLTNDYLLHKLSKNAIKDMRDNWTWDQSAKKVLEIAKHIS